MKFNELVKSYRIVTDKDMVRKNTANDYGFLLGKMHYFSTGKHIDGKWTCVYVQPHPEIAKQVEAMCCEGRIGSLRLIHMPDTHKYRMVYCDALFIAQGVLDEDVTEIPADVLPLVRII